MSALVTGDAVVLGLRPARLPSRALALVIDLAVVWAAYILISLIMALATASLDAAARAAVAVGLFLLVLVGAPIAVETLSHGRSLGKLACGLRVVRDDGGPIRFRHALVRGAMSVVEILMTLGVVACVASLVSERGRRIGDVFAGTLVVRERVSSGWAGAVPPPPPWLVGRFAALDLSRVPDELWLTVRQYLTRMRQLDPQVSWTMATRLAEDMSARTGAPCPQGVPPAAYLAAVVNERQARDARRVFAGRAFGGVAVAMTGGVRAGVPAAGRGTAAGPGGAGGPVGYAAWGAAAPAWGSASVQGASAASAPTPVPAAARFPGRVASDAGGSVAALGTGTITGPGSPAGPGAVVGAGARTAPIPDPAFAPSPATTPAARPVMPPTPGGVEGAGGAGAPTRTTGFAPPA